MIDGKEPPAKHTINMRKNRRSRLTGLKPSDSVTMRFEPGNGWMVRVYSSNGVQISHERLTAEQKSA